MCFEIAMLVFGLSLFARGLARPECSLSWGPRGKRWHFYVMGGSLILAGSGGLAYRLLRGR